jgi:LPS export ABC transporter protein LptC
MKAVQRLPFFVCLNLRLFTYLWIVMRYRFFFLLILLGSFLISCRESVDLNELMVYDGPINSATNIFLVHSDSAVVRSEITAPKNLQFLNGNEEFPEGIEIKFFTKDGQLETTMRADRGYFIKNENLYRGEGNVQIKNLLKDQSLQSEEIFWNQAEKKIYTEKFVTIQDKQTLFNGTGIEADDSFSVYSLKEVRDSRTLLPGEGI